MTDPDKPLRHVVASEGVLTREVDGELVVLDLRTERYVGLDGVGLAMWQALTTEPSVDGACSVLLERFEVEAERLRSDLEEFLADLVRRGLVMVRDGER